jgi:hypothetical protein
VSAVQFLNFNGSRQLQALNSSQTDDRGIYRLFDLQPGRYYLQAAPQNQALRNVANSPAVRVHSTVPEEGYASVFLPGVPLISQASPHELKPGEEWTGADFKFRKQPLYHIRGHIVADPLPGGVRPNVQAESGDCQQTSALLNSGIFNSGIAVPGAQNVFDLRVVSGSYCLAVREAARGLALRMNVTVKDANVDGITLTPPQPTSIKGNITIEGTPPSPLPAMGINLRSDESNQAHAQVTSDLTFQIDNIFPGKHTIVMPVTPALFIKSMLYGSTDVTNGVIPDVQPGVTLSIVLASDPGQITGTVQPGSLESGAQVMIAAIPGDALANRNDLYRVTRSWTEGPFTLAGLAPGAYKVVALEGQNFEDIQNHELLQLLAGKGAAVTIQAGSHEQVTLLPISISDVRQAKERIQ